MEMLALTVGRQGVPASEIAAVAQHTVPALQLNSLPMVLGQAADVAAQAILQTVSRKDRRQQMPEGLAVER
ncbi:hypothetical protein STVA_41060 [Allostella vacuolata]|nr:hypothetical protein STVA_41060 [Stella vacuolata]